MYNFDYAVPRRNLNACKYLNVGDDLLPMSIADMEFAAPEEVQQALHRRVDAANYGYTMMVEEDYNAVIDWCRKRHGSEIPYDHLLATPGVLNTMRCSMYALTQAGDRVLVVRPLHTPSIRSASMQGRIGCVSDLLRTADGNYTFDFEDIEQHFKSGVKVMMLCSPHNPTGRVWTRNELETLSSLVIKYSVTVISDEIHRDLILPGNTHTVLADLPEMQERVITVFSGSKTFNLGGCHIGSAVIADSKLRQRVREKLYEFGHECGRPPLFSLIAQTTAYRQCGAYADGLIAYLDKNVDLAMEYLQDLPVFAVRPQASFLLWVDCSQLKLNTEELTAMLARAGIIADPGHYYDTSDIHNYHGLQHHFRLAIGMPRKMLETAMSKLRRELQRF